MIKNDEQLTESQKHYLDLANKKTGGWLITIHTYPKLSERRNDWIDGDLKNNKEIIGYIIANGQWPLYFNKRRYYKNDIGLLISEVWDDKAFTVT